MHKFPVLDQAARLGGFARRAIGAQLRGGHFERGGPAVEDAGGGFGGAPKFPHPTDLELCLRAWAKEGDLGALEMARITLIRMCDGGIYDQLGGGFRRYSVDAQSDYGTVALYLTNTAGGLPPSIAATGAAGQAATAKGTYAPPPQASRLARGWRSTQPNRRSLSARRRASARPATVAPARGCAQHLRRRTRRRAV